MSFSQFSPELLIELLSRLLDVRTKIRLERVSRRFRDCIRNVDSWKYNTTLKMSEVRSVEDLRSLLKHVKVITQLEIHVQFNRSLSASYFWTMFMFSDKLKVTKFSYLAQAAEHCRKYEQIVACCLGKFANTLKIVHIECCHDRDCPIVTLCAMLPLCHKVTELKLGYIEKGDNVLLNSLTNMSLEKITLYNFLSTINGEHLAAVCNSAKDHSLSVVNIVRNTRMQLEPMRFELAAFCEFLEPAAAQGIKRIKLEYVDCGWVELLPTLPVVFPNLVDVRVMDFPTDAKAESAVEMAKALGDFMHASAQHKELLTVELTITCGGGKRAFGKWFWDMVDLIDASRSGTKRTANMQQWKRALTHGNVTANVEVTK